KRDLVREKAGGRGERDRASLAKSGRALCAPLRRRQQLGMADPAKNAPVAFQDLRAHPPAFRSVNLNCPNGSLPGKDPFPSAQCADLGTLDIHLDEIGNRIVVEANRLDETACFTEASAIFFIVEVRTTCMFGDRSLDDFNIEDSVEVQVAPEAGRAFLVRFE